MLDICSSASVLSHRYFLHFKHLKINDIACVTDYLQSSSWFQTLGKISNHWALDEFNVLLEKSALFFAHKFRWTSSAQEQETQSKGDQIVRKRSVDNQLKISKSPNAKVDCVLNGVKYCMMMPYTNEEEIWIRRRVTLLDEAYASVSIGENNLSEFVKGYVSNYKVFSV